MKLPHLLAATLACAALASCAQTPPAPAASEPESARLGRELRTLIGPARCSADAQCRTVPVGAMAHSDVATPRRGTGDDCTIDVVVCPYTAKTSMTSSMCVTSRTCAFMK